MKMLMWFILGFIAYPLLFVPLLTKFAPDLMAQWIHVYADYLRHWGI